MTKISSSLNTVECYDNHPFSYRYGIRSMHIMKECIKPIGVAFVLQKDSFLKNSLNKKLSQLVESGLTDKWMLDEFEKVARKLSEKSSIKYEALKENHLQVKTFGIFPSLGFLSRPHLYSPH